MASYMARHAPPPFAQASAASSWVAPRRAASARISSRDLPRRPSRPSASGGFGEYEPHHRSQGHRVLTIWNIPGHERSAVP
eukprot:2260591-Pyramimonas_sp.AAC.1